MVVPVRRAGQLGAVVAFPRGPVGELGGGPLGLRLGLGGLPLGLGLALERQDHAAELVEVDPGDLGGQVGKDHHHREAALFVVGARHPKLLRRSLGRVVGPERQELLVEDLLQGTVAGHDTLGRLGGGVEPDHQNPAPRERGVGRRRPAAVLADVADGFQDLARGDVLPVRLVVVVEVEPRGAEGHDVDRVLGDAGLARLGVRVRCERHEAPALQIDVAAREGVGGVPQVGPSRLGAAVLPGLPGRDAVAEHRGPDTAFGVDETGVVEGAELGAVGGGWTDQGSSLGPTRGGRGDEGGCHDGPLLGPVAGQHVRNSGRDQHDEDTYAEDKVNRGPDLPLRGAILAEGDRKIAGTRGYRPPVRHREVGCGRSVGGGVGKDTSCQARCPGGLPWRWWPSDEEN